MLGTTEGEEKRLKEERKRRHAVNSRDKRRDMEREGFKTKVKGTL